MRKRSVIVLAVAFVAALGVVIWWTVASRPPAVPDPVYDGYPLSDWLNPASGVDKFAHGPPSLDSNAVPYLVQVLSAGDGTLRMGYGRLWSHFPALLKRAVPDPMPEEYARRACCNYLGDLGAAARPAIPELVRVLRGGSSSIVVVNAAVALGRIADGEDKPVVEALLAATKDPRVEVRQAAVYSLGYVANGQDKPVVEALVVAATKETNAWVRDIAGAALWHLNPDAAARAGIASPTPATSPWVAPVGARR